MFDPFFWEVSVERETLEGFRNEDRLWNESREEREIRYRSEDRVTDWMEEIKRIIERELTQRQREAATLYFFHRKTQEEVARILGISRRVVGQHLFGIRRNGRRIGGAIKKIRKICTQRPLSP